MEPFKELQRFDQWWIKVIMALPLFEALAFVLNDYQSKGEVESDSLIFLLAIILIVTLIFWFKLTVEINEKRIVYRFSLFHLKPRQIEWNDVEKAYIRTYKPLWEYGGWGIRWSFRNGKAINVKGNVGLQLELKNGKKILIGTSEEQKLNTFLQYIKTKFSITAIQ
jgi:hypothetical protein